MSFLPWTTAAACLLFPLTLWLSRQEYAAVQSDPALHATTVIAHGLCTWMLISAFIGLALRLFDRESPWTLYASQSAYWVYLAHMPAIGLAVWLLLPLGLPAGIEFLLVLTFAVVACFASYHYAVQRTWVSRFLNGKRFDLDWPWRKPAVATASD